MKRLLVILIILAPITCLAQENAVKMTSLGWLIGSSKFSFERALGSDDLPQSGELALSWIGAGMDKFGNDPQGFTVRYGHKLFLGEHDAADPLQGFFVKPEIVFSHFQYDNSVQQEGRRLRFHSLVCAFVINQFVWPTRI